MKRLVVLLALVPAVAAAEPVERRLHADQVTASSFLWNDWNRFQENYHPLYVSDDDPKTAWTEGVDGDGIGEWIRLRTTEMEGAVRLRLHIRNGYQKSHSLFLANERPKEVTLKLLPSGVAKQVTLADAEGWQDVSIEQPAGKLDGVELKIESTYPGTKYTDTCISDIQVFVTAETHENPAFEKSKLDKVLAWKAERLAAAKMFKQASKELPLLPAYKEIAGKEGKDDFPWDECKRDQLCFINAVLGKMKGADEAVALAKKVLGADAVPARLAPTDSRPIPTVDGLGMPSLYELVEGPADSGFMLPLVNVVAALRADQLGAIQLEGAEVKATLDDVLTAKAPGCKSKAGATYTWMVRDKIPAGTADAGRERLRALLMVRCARVEVRDGRADLALPQVAVYDTEGRLTLTAGRWYVNRFQWTGKVLTGGSAVYGDGGTAELTRPEAAQK